MSQPRATTVQRILFGLLAGAIGGVTAAVVVPPAGPLAVDLAVSAVLGVLFGLVAGPRVRTAGTGLVWGQAFGLLWWLFGTITLTPLLAGRGLRWTAAAAQESLPILLGHVIGYGAVLGLAYFVLTRAWAWQVDREADEEPVARGPVAQTIVAPPVRAVIVGGLGGLLGSWLFARGVQTAEFFPLVAGLMGSDAMSVGRVLHYGIGTTIGISFGLIFSRDVRGVGSSLVWGMNYGLVWWTLGPMTLLPLWLGMQPQPDWSLQAAQEHVPALVAHMLYGAIVGLFYALANRVWRALFVDSDPVNRALESPGSLGLRLALMGLGAGIIGGLLFTIIMATTGALEQLATVVMAESELAGLVVHLVISIIVGISYGLLFGRETASYGTGLAWGTAYGLTWWLVGGATLFPLLLRQPVDWSLETLAGFYPSLIGHLLYGIGLGLVFQFLARRYGDRSLGRAGRGLPASESRTRVPTAAQLGEAGRRAPALWVVTLVLGVILPLLLSIGV